MEKTMGQTFYDEFRHIKKKFSETELPEWNSLPPEERHCYNAAARHLCEQAVVEIFR